jgi:hypothetical protein
MRFTPGSPIMQTRFYAKKPVQSGVTDTSSRAGGATIWPAQFFSPPLEAEKIGLSQE